MLAGAIVIQPDTRFQYVHTLLYDRVLSCKSNSEIQRNGTVFLNTLSCKPFVKDLFIEECENLVKAVHVGTSANRPVTVNSFFVNQAKIIPSW